MCVRVCAQARVCACWDQFYRAPPPPLKNIADHHPPPMTLRDPSPFAHLTLAKGVCLTYCPEHVIGMSDVRFERWLEDEVSDWVLLDATPAAGSGA